MKRILPLILAVLFVSAIVPARATDEHDYEKGEYAIIRDGLAPDKKKSLAAHGEGPPTSRLVTSLNRLWPDIRCARRPSMA